MRKLTAGLFISIFLLSSCGKNDTSGCQPKSVDGERPEMQGYCTTYGITCTLHPSGMLYQIMDAGTGATPTTTSTVTVSYVGRHMNNTGFDSSMSYTNIVSGFIDGWKAGLPLIKKGGRIKLVIPSAMAYSCLGSKKNDIYIIQPDEPIFFDITLIDVK